MKAAVEGEADSLPAFSYIAVVASDKNLQAASPHIPLARSAP